MTGIRAVEIVSAYSNATKQNAQLIDECNRLKAQLAQAQEQIKNLQQRNETLKMEMGALEKENRWMQDEIRKKGE